jgi:hypothetical protein
MLAVRKNQQLLTPTCRSSTRPPFSESARTPNSWHLPPSQWVWGSTDTTNILRGSTLACHRTLGRIVSLAVFLLAALSHSCLSYSRKSSSPATSMTHLRHHKLENALLQPPILLLVALNYNFFFSFVPYSPSLCHRPTFSSDRMLPLSRSACSLSTDTLF